MNKTLLGLAFFGSTIASSLIAATAIPGDFDQRFGTGGSVITTFGALSSFTPSCVMVQPDGKIVVVGTSPGSSGHPDFTLVRYLENGNFDTTFGTGGKVVENLSGTYYEDFAQAAIMQSDGKFVVAGYSNGKFAVARFSTSGAFDTTFGTNGVVVLSNSIYPKSGVGASAVAIQSDGKIIIAGPRVAAATGNVDFGLFRFTANGVLDTGFEATTDFGSLEDSVTGMAVTSADKIIVVGYTNPPGPTDYQGAIACYTANGILDTTFSGDGKATLAVGVSGTFFEDVKVLSTGQILVCGAATPDPLVTSTDFLLARYGTDGSLDETFGNSGVAMADMTSVAGARTSDKAQCISIQPDGYIMACGTSEGTSVGGGDPVRFALSRYQPDGSLDLTFGTNGMTIASIGNDKDALYASALQADGKIVVTGTTKSGNYVNFATARFWGFTPHETWRLKYFGSIANTGNAADDMDFDLDGQTNLFEYALGTPPTSGANGACTLAYSLAHVGLHDYPTATITKPNGEEDLIYSMEVSGDLNQWFTDVPYTTVIIDDSTTIQLRDNTYLTTNGRRFARITVALPSNP